MDYLPIFMRLQQQPCLVVGAGSVAVRKISLLLRAGGNVSIIAEKIGNEAQQLQAENKVQISIKKFTETDAEGFALIVAATNDKTSNSQIAAAAKRLNIPVNVVDCLALCSFIFPAIIDRSPVVAAVSSSGHSPVLARILKSKIQTLIAPAFGELADLVAQFRTQVKSRFSTAAQRRIFWEQVLEGSVAELVFVGKKKAAVQKLQTLLEDDCGKTQIGEVYLLGAGPGDPDLLTIRALRLLQKADVVLYDRLISDAVLQFARADAEKIYVGKQRKNHELAQDSINQLLVKLAKQGKRVARLKGGDPFIFGRGGEEIATLSAQGINFQVVPGVTAALGCASYAGIPLTHRDHAQSCTFVTGHLQDDKTEPNWQQLIAPKQTIVFYMGLATLGKICLRLVQHGCPKDLPIAIIQQGTTANQRVLTGVLDTFAAKVKAANIKAPTLIIVGTVVLLHDKLAWLDE